jgi:hypothetical protein
MLQKKFARFFLCLRVEFLTTDKEKKLTTEFTENIIF